MKFSERDILISKFYAELSDDAKKYIHRVECQSAANKDEIQTIFRKYIEQKYEGAIARNLDGLYKYGVKTTGTRSKDVIKIKDRESDEFKIIGFEQGTKGKAAGTITWRLETADGKEFKTTYTGMSIADQQRIYQDCLANFDTKYKGKMMTVEYQDLSNDGVPSMGKAVSIRDYE
jgi:DNA ligase-1